MTELKITLNEEENLYYITENLLLFPFSAYDLWAIITPKNEQLWVKGESPIYKLSEKIRDEFNGDKGRTQLSFLTKWEAEKCLQWIESVLILNKLCK